VDVAGFGGVDKLFNYEAPLELAYTDIGVDQHQKNET
jgi:hypothetical protein